MATAEAPTFAPYVCTDSGRTIGEVFAHVNEQVYLGYGSDYRHAGPGKPIAGSLFDFRALLEGLTEQPHLDFVEHWRLLAEPCPPDRIRVGIRHDIDTDIVAAVRLAELEAEYGVVANWLVLHTAWYYGQFVDGTFGRNGCMAHVYRRLQELGHEVSIHSDPLSIYQDHGIDGAEAFVAELAWLRDEGLTIRGSTAHNFRPTYGAENFEVFTTYVAGGPSALGPDVDHVIHEGRYAPLRVLDPHELGLEYEGNQVFWQRRSQPLAYGATRTSNTWRWNAHLARRRSSPEEADTQFIDQERLLAEIADLPVGSDLVLVVHPAYYGARPEPSWSPPRRVHRCRTVQNPELGWQTYTPFEPVCWVEPSVGDQQRQAINHANEAGMLDLPWPTDPPDDQTLSVLLLGGEDLDGRSLPVPVHLQVRLTELIADHGGRPTSVVKLAHPGMGIDRLWSWYRRARNRLRPDIVVIGVSERADTLANPVAWSAETGISPQHPSGDYLAYDDDTGAVSEIDASPEWAAHERDPHPTADDDVPGMQSDRVVALHRHVVDAVRADGARPLLMVERRDDPGFDPVALSRAVGAELVDPYRWFAEAGVEPRRPWGMTEHRLAADALYDAMEITATVG